MGERVNTPTYILLSYTCTMDLSFVCKQPVHSRRANNMLLPSARFFLPTSFFYFLIFFLLSRRIDKYDPAGDLLGFKTRRAAVTSIITIILGHLKRDRRMSFIIFGVYTRVP